MPRVSVCRALPTSSPQFRSRTSFQKVEQAHESSFSKRIFQRRTLRREQLRTVLGDVHIVFEANAEFSAKINARLVAGGHVRLELGRVAANQIRPLVAVHSQSVA